jgi:hypothetical protein
MAGQPLDAIIKKELYGTRDDSGTNYITINVSDNSDFDDISGSEQGGLLAISYENGVGNDIDLVVQGSDDGVNFASFVTDDATENVTDASGEIIFDLVQVNANFIRLAWIVNSGSMDVYVRTSFKRRH